MSGKRFIPTGVGNGDGCRDMRGHVGGSSPRVWGTEFGDSFNEISTRFIPTGVGNGQSTPNQLAFRPVHPHGCGERDVPVEREIHIGRFIPTGVGNGPRPTGNAEAHPVHPHGCGERTVNRRYRPNHDGSSPRVWGTARRGRPPRGKTRFIPTGVGNGKVPGESHMYPTVHPHGCGERDSVRMVYDTIAGSSPRVWGTGYHALISSRKGRFIPTGVGNGGVSTYC